MIPQSELAPAPPAPLATPTTLPTPTTPVLERRGAAVGFGGERRDPNRAATRPRSVGDGASDLALAPMVLAGYRVVCCCELQAHAEEG